MPLVTAAPPSAPLRPGRLAVIAGALADPAWLADDRASALLATRPALGPWLARFRSLRPLRYDDSGPILDELAHERWLRDWLADRTGPAATSAPGRLAAMRAAAEGLADGDWPATVPRGGAAPLWLVEPTHLHLATDHLVLLHGAAGTLAAADAAALLDAVRPLLDEIGLDCAPLDARRWLLWQAAPGADPAPVTDSAAAAASVAPTAIAPSAAAAQGHNVDAYLPRGPAGRPLRRLFNASQMAWHEHPVNLARARRGEATINSVWISGPCTGSDVDAWRQATRGDAGPWVDDSPLLPRLNADAEGWGTALLDALSRLAAAEPPVDRLVLCGERTVRQLETDGAGGGRRVRGDGGAADGLGSRLRAWLARAGGRRPAAPAPDWFVER